MYHYIDIIPCSQRNEEGSCRFHLAEEDPKLHYFGAFNQTSSRRWVMWVYRERQCKRCWWRDRPLPNLLSLQLQKNVIKRCVFILWGEKRLQKKTKCLCLILNLFLAAECSWIDKILVQKSRTSILPSSNRRNFRSVPVLCDKSAFFLFRRDNTGKWLLPLSCP